MSHFTLYEQLRMYIFLALLLPCSICAKKISTTTVDISAPYRPNWTDLDTRPLPDWYDKGKIGIFVHWGVYSVPSFQSEWFWKYWDNGQKFTKQFMEKHYPGHTYQDFAKKFRAKKFRPKQWATLFAKAGAKYVVITSKYHDGYTLFPSKFSKNWNVMDVGPKIDLVGKLGTAVKKAGMKYGLYYSLYEWFNPMYLRDRNQTYKTSVYVKTKMWPELKQIVNDYQPSLLWADGDWQARDKYWKSRHFLAWLYNTSPVKKEVVVNDRWGLGISCHHGDFFTCKENSLPGVLQHHKWESVVSLDKLSFGYRKDMNITDVLTMKELLTHIVTSVSCGGNVLISIGPTKDGKIDDIFIERLLDLGKWLRVNGEAIYDTSPFHIQNDTLNPNVWYTCTKNTYDPYHPTAVPLNSDVILAVYIIFLEWPANNSLVLEDSAAVFNTNSYVEFLGYHEVLDWTLSKGTVTVFLPKPEKVDSKEAWTLKLTQEK